MNLKTFLSAIVATPLAIGLAGCSDAENAEVEYEANRPIYDEEPGPELDHQNAPSINQTDPGTDEDAWTDEELRSTIQDPAPEPATTTFGNQPFEDASDRDSDPAAQTPGENAPSPSADESSKSNNADENQSKPSDQDAASDQQDVEEEPASELPEKSSDDENKNKDQSQNKDQSGN